MTENNITANVVREITVPAAWYLGAHGDPVAHFDYLVLRLHDDGTVTWRSDRPESDSGS